jgi:flagellar basal-body rod protein FlgC
MSGIFSIALSGMQAAQAQLAVGANNIANANTPGFKASRVDLVELSGGGVAVAGTQVDQTPGAIGPDGTQASNVDLASEMVGLIQDKTLYNANAMVVRTEDKMMGSLLDMFDTGRNRDRS